MRRAQAAAPTSSSSALTASLVASSKAVLPLMSWRAGREQEGAGGRGKRWGCCACRPARRRGKRTQKAAWQGRCRLQRPQGGAACPSLPQRRTGACAPGPAGPHLDPGVGARLEQLLHLAVIALGAGHEEQQVAGVGAAWRTGGGEDGKSEGGGWGVGLAGRRRAARGSRHACCCPRQASGALARQDAQAPPWLTRKHGLAAVVGPLAGQHAHVLRRGGGEGGGGVRCGWLAAQGVPRTAAAWPPPPASSCSLPNAQHPAVRRRAAPTMK